MFSELKLPRYKYVVNTTIGEQRGAGVKVGAKCLWDSDTDQLAQDIYISVRGYMLLGKALSYSCAVSRVRCTVVWQRMQSTTTKHIVIGAF